MKHQQTLGILTLLFSFLLSCNATEKVGVLTIHGNQQGASIAPGMYGIFFEEINHSGIGGLYPELIRNRDFEEGDTPSGMVERDGYVYAPHLKNYSTGAYSDFRLPWNADSLQRIGWHTEGRICSHLTTEHPLHPNTPHSLCVSIGQGGASIVNEGFWGIAVRKRESYLLRFFLCPYSYSGDVEARIVSETGQILSRRVFKINSSQEWKEYKAQLTPASTCKKGTFQLVFGHPGELCMDYVSLFPENTFHHRPNGLRSDIAQLLADLHPGFLRWPGGCIVEGMTLDNRMKWKETLGDPMTRKGEWLLWNYHTNWGFGFHEFLQFCEDINAKPLFVANVGMSCSVRNGDYTDSLNEYIQDINDAIEYANGPVTSKWGALRAQAGHPAPFHLRYIELGNEQSGDFYAHRYNQLYAVLKKQHPDICFISTLQMEKSRDLLKKADMIDPHWYADPVFFHESTHLFDTVPRGKYKIYVGEFATITDANLRGALAEAAFMFGMEQNGDLVSMASEAPLIENSNHRDWPTNLIKVNNDQVFGRTSYHVQKMLADNLPAFNLQTTFNRQQLSAFVGRIGFIGSGSDVQYRNIRIVDQKGKQIYKSDNIEGWSKFEGRHQSMFSLFNRSVMLLDRVINPGTRIEFDTRAVKEKITSAITGHSFTLLRQGDEVTVPPGFIFGADKDAENYMTLSFGDPGRNQLMTILKTIDGKTSFNRSTEGVNADLKAGEWHHVIVEMRSDHQLVCTIDGQQRYSTAVERVPLVHAIAGYDDKEGDVIIKMVNASRTPLTIPIDLKNIQTEGKASATTLAAPSLDDENTFENPNKIVPVHQSISVKGTKLRYKLKPYSLTILRIKGKRIP